MKNKILKLDLVEKDIILAIALIKEGSIIKTTAIMQILIEDEKYIPLLNLIKNSVIIKNEILIPKTFRINNIKVIMSDNLLEFLENKNIIRCFDIYNVNIEGKRTLVKEYSKYKMPSEWNDRISLSFENNELKVIIL